MTSKLALAEYLGRRKSFIICEAKEGHLYPFYYSKDDGTDEGEEGGGEEEEEEEEEEEDDDEDEDEDDWRGEIQGKTDGAEELESVEENELAIEI